MSTQGNGGIYSKFQERLRKMRLSRIKKKEKNNEFIEGRIKDIRETIRAGNGEIRGTDSVSRVVVNIRSTAQDRAYFKNKVGVVEKNDVTKNVSKGDSLDDKVENIRENKPIIKRKKVGYVYNIKNFKDISYREREELLHNMGSDIMDKLKSGFEDKLDELEVLYSELYILSHYQNSEVELKKVKELKDKINELIVKVNAIIEQYNLYKRNYYIDNVIGLDDNVIVDDIINYRTLLDSFDDEKKFVKEYKALDEFKALYDNLVEIRDETEKLQIENEEKIVEYQIRDKKHDDVKLGLVKSLDIDSKCMLEIDRQNEYFDKLMEKINIIDKNEYVTAHLRGLGNLLGSGLKFIGLLVMSPLNGLIPGISMQTLATRRLVANAYKHIHLEEVRHVRYEAINYEAELNHHLTDVNYAEDLIDNTLKDVNKLKEEFMYIYDSKIPGYEDTLKKITKIEEKLLRSQNKVAIVKKKLYHGKKINDDKLKKVRVMNDNKRVA